MTDVLIAAAGICGASVFIAAVTSTLLGVPFDWRDR